MRWGLGRGATTGSRGLRRGELRFSLADVPPAGGPCQGPGHLLAVSRKRSFLSVCPVWGWQHHPRRRLEIIFPVSLNSRIIGDLPCPITRRRSPFAFGVATMRNATPCLRFARVVIAANAIVGLLADSALVAHKWPPPGGVIKRQTQEGKLTVSDNLGTGTVPPSRA